MKLSTREILDILDDYEIRPEEIPEGVDLPTVGEGDFPEVGQIAEGETVYATSLEAVLAEQGDGDVRAFEADDPRILEWLQEIRRIAEDVLAKGPAQSLPRERREPPEPHCAWYCPIHFFGHGWGIYIRERCILDLAVEIARFVDWRLVHMSAPFMARQLLRSAFYVFFLHEQFHHKVESLGFRLLVARTSDCYRPYKARVYRRAYLGVDCLEESLANADSYRRLGEPRYVQRVDKPIRDGLRAFLKASIPLQPPGYAEGIRYLRDNDYKAGLHKLQSQILEASPAPSMPLDHWSVAPNMITALTDITDDIYVVLPKGARPIFRPTSVDPGATVSSKALEGALTKHYGYQRVRGGKGSHVKLAKPGASTIILPGDRGVLSPGVVKQALAALGGYPISRLPELLEGRLVAVH